MDENSAKDYFVERCMLQVLGGYMFVSSRLWVPWILLCQKHWDIYIPSSERT